MLETLMNSKDEAKAQCRILCDYFGGIGVFGRQKPFDTEKACIFIEFAKESQSALDKQYDALCYALQYLWQKGSPDWGLLQDEMKKMGISDEEQEALPLDDDLLASIHTSKLTEIADVINEMKALRFKRQQCTK